LDGPSPPRRPAVLARYDRLALLIGMKSSRKHMQRQWRRSKRGPAHSRGAAPVRSGFLVTGWLTSDSQRSTHTPTPTAHFHPGSAIDIIPCETHRNWSLQLPLHLPERSAWVRQNVRFQEPSMHFGTAVPHSADQRRACGDRTEGVDAETSGPTRGSGGGILRGVVGCQWAVARTRWCTFMRVAGAVSTTPTADIVARIASRTGVVPP
jgi:hypothetical protein